MGRIGRIECCMALRTLLISIVVAGFFAGLVLVSGSLGGKDEGDGEMRVRGLGIDPVSVVEIRVESVMLGGQMARRTAGTVDGWVVRIEGVVDGLLGEEWAADVVRVRTVLRALGSASISVVDDEGIGEVFGSLGLVDQDGGMTEIRFGTQAAGGFVRAEIVTRGVDGIATSRWFGRMERSLRDSLVGEGLGAWRSMELFDVSMSQVVGVEVSAGGDSVTIERGGVGWRVVDPWEVGADREMVQGLVGLVLGLTAERYYDASVYSDELTGLGEPIARIAIDGRDGERMLIALGAAVDATGKEVFGRYRRAGGGSVVAVKTAGLNRLTASALAYVRKTASGMSVGDVGELRVLDSSGLVRFACRPRLDGWEVDGVVVSVSQKKAIDRLVGVLMMEDAGRVFEIGDDGMGAGIGEIEVVSRGGETERFGVLIEARKGGIELSLWRGVGDGVGLMWVFGSEGASGTGAWIGALVAGVDEE